MGFPGDSVVKNSAAMREMQVRSLDQADPLEKEMAPVLPEGNLLQHSWLENPMDRGAWCATVHEVTKNWTRLSD